jgi:hypothetical protein
MEIWPHAHNDTYMGRKKYGLDAASPKLWIAQESYVLQ